MLAQILFKHREAIAMFDGRKQSRQCLDVFLFLCVEYDGVL